MRCSIPRLSSDACFNLLRYSKDVQELIKRLLTVDPTQRPDIDAVLDRLEVLNPS
jgi:serine/threonine protein kinase